MGGALYLPLRVQLEEETGLDGILQKLLFAYTDWRG